MLLLTAAAAAAAAADDAADDDDDDDDDDAYILRYVNEFVQLKDILVCACKKLYFRQR